MADDRTRCLICSCEKTMAPDLELLSGQAGLRMSPLYRQLCRSQLKSFEKELAAEEDLIVACTAEAPLFEEVAEETGKGGRVRYANIREFAGWSKDGPKAGPKMAALLHDAAHEPRPAELKSITSDGLCLVYGAGQQAMEVARLLSPRLSVTVVLSEPGDAVLPAVADIPVYRGRVVSARGSFGGFSLTLDDYAPLKPSSRGGLEFEEARQGAETTCSLILDLSGQAPLFTGHDRRDGYGRADPGDPAAVLRAAFELSGMVGPFEKPIYVEYDAGTCAHARSRITGCSKCLDACPAGAITEAGDGVSIDPGICGGCGLCSALCPTGSISYRYPERADMVVRGQGLVGAYLAAGGARPVLLVHDTPIGADLIAAMARFGKGLPANVLPVAVHKATSVGHVELAAWFAAGVEQVVVLFDPRHAEEAEVAASEGRLTGEILDGLGLGGGGRVRVVSEGDPERVEEVLWSLPRMAPLAPAVFAPQGTKREVARLAFGALRGQARTEVDLIPLPEGAPYGRIDIDRDACTLCMACTSACPAGAVIDTPGEPKLRFVEAACVQCGLCTATCPENALTLVPGLNLSPAAMQPETLYEEEPFNCVACGKPFATRSTIERIKAQLAGSHAMFASPEKARLIEMCETCRVQEQANSPDDPFAAGPRPRPRTTEDYLAAEKGGPGIDDFLIGDD